MFISAVECSSGFIALLLRSVYVYALCFEHVPAYSSLLLLVYDYSSSA
jgi:hypothetical protein